MILANAFCIVLFVGEWPQRGRRGGGGCRLPEVALPPRAEAGAREPLRAGTGAAAPEGHGEGLNFISYSLSPPNGEGAHGGGAQGTRGTQPQPPPRGWSGQDAPGSRSSRALPVSQPFSPWRSSTDLRLGADFPPSSPLPAVSPAAPPAPFQRLGSRLGKLGSWLGCLRWESPSPRPDRAGAAGGSLGARCRENAPIPGKLPLEGAAGWRGELPQTALALG